ncbi:hypothetical protein L1987_30183 [Smallanthus sonchifolius]|uniref:Uncharacterized protein n=1 Tax=Smallanthus sonchifolius TaxID=185202 RepID=A0ACB9I1H5_9ASTR|nr:hypothetical protein L1987_30183 [Smallanthus sonchifolius]
MRTYMSDHIPVIEILDTNTENEVLSYNTFATSFEPVQDIMDMEMDGYGRQCGATQADSVASDHSARPTIEIRVIYTRRKRKSETEPSDEPEPKKAREDVPSTFEVGEFSRTHHDLATSGESLHFWISDLELEQAEMRKKLDAESLKVEAAEAGL